MPAVLLSTSQASLALRTEMVDEGRIITRPWAKIFLDIFATAIPSFLAGSNAAKAQVSAANYADGSIFYELDRRVAYIAIAGRWVYLTGCATTDSGHLPVGLGADDFGLLVNVSDYSHQLIWVGNSWTWAPGELGGDFIMPFLTGPDPSAGWQPCDGSLGVLKMNFDGTLSFVDVPNTPGSWYRL